MLMSTETIDPRFAALDELVTHDLVTTFIDDQVLAIQAVKAAHDSIAYAVESAVKRLEQGGRLIYVGAGTSGRLGMLDSSELLPTFAWPSDRAIAMMAGGQSAYFHAVEGAEDNIEEAIESLSEINISELDVVIGLAASGRTPFTISAVRFAKQQGALTIGIANNPNTPLVTEAEISIVLDTGAEVIAGSTRLKAGTAQKVVLNTLSSAIMVRLNKVLGNLMIDMQPTNQKLLIRAIYLVMNATNCTEEKAQQVLKEANNSVKLAILMVKNNISVGQAKSLLEKTHGNLRKAIY